MTMITDTTAAHPAPTWAADPSTDVLHERGEGVHPDDASTSYTRQLDSWETTPQQAHISCSTLQVTLHAWRYDDGSDDFDTAAVWEDGTPGQHLVAADARRLGQALLQAADLLEGPAMTAMPHPTTTERCDAEPFRTCGQRPVPVWGAVGYVRAVLGEVLDRLPAGPERDRLSDALDVLRRAGVR